MTNSPGPGTALISERHGSVLLLTMNRPLKHHAINREMGDALAGTLREADEDEDVSVVVLTGAGDSAFCAGADMGEQLRSETRGGAERAISAAASFSKPLIAAVNGFAYGGGALLAATCDFRFGSSAARFRFLGAAYGLVVGAAQLARICGEPLAKELLFTARDVSAEEAVKIGLLNRLCDGPLLLEETLATAAQVAANSLAALRASKQVVDLATGVDAAWRLEIEHNLRLRGSNDQTERFVAAAGRVLGKSDSAPTTPE